MHWFTLRSLTLILFERDMSRKDMYTIKTETVVNTQDIYINSTSALVYT